MFDRSVSRKSGAFCPLNELNEEAKEGTIANIRSTDTIAVSVMSRFIGRDTIAMFLCLSLHINSYSRQKKGKRETARLVIYNSFSTVSAMFTWLGLVNAVEGSRSESGPTLVASCGAEAPLLTVMTSL